MKAAAGFGRDAPGLWISKSSEPRSSVHLALSSPDKPAVRAFHAAALTAGAKDNGAPGPRDYAPNYYAAFVLDPDGNNIEAAATTLEPETAASFRGKLRR